MRHYRLTNQERANNPKGYTDCIVLLHGDFTAAATSETINLFGLAKGDIVEDAILEIVTPFDHAAAGTQIDLGVTDHVDKLLDGQNLEAAANSVYLLGAGTNAVAGRYEEDDTSKYVTAKLISTTDNVSATTAGEARIWISVNRAADRRDVQA